MLWARAVARLQVEQRGSWQLNAVRLCCHQHAKPLRRRNLRRRSRLPVAGGLLRNRHLFGNGASAAERLENLIDYMHTSFITDYRYSAQEPPLPLLSDFGILTERHNRCMPEFAFDPDRVKVAMREQRVTQDQLAKEIGLTHKSALLKIFNGTRRVQISEATKIYDFLRLSPDQAVGVQYVPVIGLGSAGRWREAVEQSGPRMTIPAGIASDRAFAIEVVGDSMNLLIKDGGWIVVDPGQKSLMDGKCYLIQNAEYEVTVKAYRTKPPRFEPMSDNDEHQPFLVSDCEFIVLGRVVWTGSPL